MPSMATNIYKYLRCSYFEGFEKAQGDQAYENFSSDQSWFSVVLKLIIFQKDGGPKNYFDG